MNFTVKARASGERTAAQTRMITESALHALAFARKLDPTKWDSVTIFDGRMEHTIEGFAQRHEASNGL